ncbi:MAG: hypothetical protein H6744_03740 [Deltaproteobacteria bacterium]|nr:hypothetical protein [Deltaproteobacteria bacterium]MCB9785789.1 hypothetical protein [Deltaproteobacteria bacterium]
MTHRDIGTRAALASGLVALLLAGVAGAAPPAEGAGRPCVPAAPGERFDVDWREVPLRSVTRLVSCALERSLLFSPQTLGDRRVTVVAPRPVSARELEALWRGVLAEERLLIEAHGAYELIRAEDQVPSKSRSSSGR